jgi:hypothetical protein
MKLIEINDRCLINAWWDWKWFGFELSYNGHEKFFNINIAWLSINIFVGRA